MNRDLQRWLQKPSRLIKTALLVLIVPALIWAALWWVPGPILPITGDGREMSAKWHHRHSAACETSAPTLSQLAAAVALRFPDSDCGWTVGDLALAQQAAVTFRNQVAAHLALYHEPSGDPRPPSVSRPRYSLFRTRASVVVGWRGPEASGGARCYFRRTIGGWRAQTCSIWMA